MLRRILALAVIFVCTSVAWFLLAGAVFFRTYGAQQVLGSRVATTWGAPLRQKPPVACSGLAGPLALTASRVDVDVDLEPRQKGLLWYATYALLFRGTYTFEAPAGAPADTAVTLRLPLPAADAVYDNIVLDVDGAPARWEREPARPDAPPALAVTIPPHPGRPIVMRAAYRTRGQDTFTYDIGDRAAARDFTLTLTTNFAGYDVPDNALSPTSVVPRAGGGTPGKTLTWRFDNIVSGQPVTLALPQKLQPGPVVGRISLFAPVSLLLFFFVMFVITVVRGVDLHPMNYFFLATAFFAFHLLLAYLVDVIPVAPAFAIASAVSVGLVISYLRLVAGVRFALFTAGAAQLVYLVLFSAAFFVEGLTGLAVTLVSVATLFVTMQVTGRIRWGAKFAPAAPPAASPPPVVPPTPQGA